MVMPEPVRLHELPNASRQLLGGTPPYYNSADGNTIVTHAALRHIETQHLWIVELWPTAPYLSPQESGVVAKACYLSDMDTFRAAIAITPFHDWDAEMFPLRTLREGI